MKGRSNRLPTSDPPDDWMNGSWTVDCICGVNFDDGEEMVNCDECGVWVHTRCSRFVKGEKSFACDKCKNKTSIRNDSEETEVAQLLVELPTKTIKMNNPYPLSNSIPPPRRPYRLWTDRPIEERVHVQGIPGGDPALFQGLPSIFSSELWKCAGYVPKKFSFCYREFPCWDKQQDINPKAEGDTENTVDKGAGVLYSLSKDTVVAARAPVLVNMRGQAKGGGSDKKASKERKSEGGDPKHSSVHNLVKKEKSVLRPIVLQCGKRSREDLGPSKDRTGKKKSKAIHKERDSKVDKIHASKAVVTQSTNVRQLEVNESKAQKVLKPDASNGKHGPEKDAGSQEVGSNAHLNAGSNIEKHKSNAASHEGNLVPRSCQVSGLGLSNDKSCKLEKLGHDASDQLQKSAKIEVMPLSLLEDDANVSNPLKKEALVSDEIGRNQGACAETPTSDLQKKFFVEDGGNDAPEVKDTEILKDLETNTLLSSGHCNSKTNSDANVDNPKEVPKSYASDVGKSDNIKDLTGQVLSADHESENSKLNETVSSSLSHEGQSGDKGLDVVNGCQIEKHDDATDNPCKTKVEFEGFDSSTTMTKISSDTKEVPRVGGLPKLTGAVPPPPPSQHKIVSFGKSCSSSSTIVISRSSLSDKNRTGNSQNPSSVGKRVISSSSMSTKKENTPVDLVKDEEKHEKSKSTIKDNSKPSSNSILKTSQPSRTANAHVFKNHTSAGKDSLRHPSSKSSSVESSSLPLGVEPAGTSQMQHGLHLQNKNTASGGQQRGEKVPQSNLQSSSKSSLGHVPVSSNSPAGLSDEELALLLHQELNSSPRVPRVPRVRHVGSLPQLSSASPTSMLIKRTSSSGGKDQNTFSRRKSKDGSRSSREHDNEARKFDKVPSSPDSAKTSDALTQVEANSESLHSARKNVEQSSISAVDGSPISADANELKVSTTQCLPVNSPEDDTCPNKGLAPTHRTLPGLIAEIMGKGRRMTYEELCNAVLPHWQNLRKHNGERYAYSSHSQAVLDCLRNRTEWARLVDRGPKTNTSRKKRKTDNNESEDGEERSLNDGESKSLESNKEEYPKGRRKARKRRRLALQGKGIKKDDKRRRSSDNTGSSSNSSEDNSVCSDDESQGSGMCGARSEVSASSDETAAVS